MIMEDYYKLDNLYPRINESPNSSGVTMQSLKVNVLMKCNIFLLGEYMKGKNKEI